MLSSPASQSSVSVCSPTPSTPSTGMQSSVGTLAEEDLWDALQHRPGGAAHVTVVKVKAHRALQDATSLEDLWKLRGNRLADA